MSTRTAINPWHRPDSGYSSPTYKLDGLKPVLVHRGVEVFRWPAGGFLHVLNGMAVRHLAGLDKTGASIDALLDGDRNSHNVGLCGDRVASHLRASGFTPRTYSEAAPDAKGRG